MYARNSGSPKPITVGTITKISDGVVQTTGVSVKTSKDGAAYVTGGGSLSVEDGEWSYLPTQAETDCESLRIVIAKTDCYSRSITVVFTASSSFGYAGTDQSKITNATASVALTNTTVGIVTDVTTKSGYSLSSGSITAIFAALTNTMTTVGSVGKLIVDNLNAAVGSIPTNPLLTTDSRLNNLNAPIGSIPTNTLLTNDTRLLNLDLPISSVNTAIGNLNNLSALINIYGSPLLEIPDAGSTLYAFTIVVRDNEGKLVNLDILPTVTASNASGTSRSANLGSVTNPSTGRYIFTYSVSNTHPQENLRIVGSGTVSGESRYIEWIGSTVNYDTLTVLQSVQTTINSIDTRLPAFPAAVSDIPTSSQNAIAVWANATRTLSAFNFQVTVGGYAGGQVPLQSLGANAPVGWINDSAIATDAITNDKVATSAITEIVTGVWTQNLSSFGANTAGKNLVDTLANTATLLTRIPVATAQLVTDLAFMLVGSGTSLVRWTVQALSLAPSGSGGGGSISVTPEAFINLDNTLLEKNVFTFFNNEARTYLVTLASGTFDGQPMTFCLEKSDKTNLLVVTGLTSVTNSVSVALSAIAEQTDKCMFWSLRDSTTGRIILYGPAVQKYAAFNN